ncbi:phospholipase D-like domain-containing protein [Pelagerythrobacter marensis]|uniref:Phospholipase D n=1 Tax=Pelagerythrobacter marensis TaxID=543877 RepID=A0A0G3X6J7_9SPHN|nr:phospholipase D-like domain-containing protein [Pelagerythrobacter marensis]AKM07160.1 Phospholipase D/Transphosphatidylase [Pelagerythrobacter marensis]
MNAGDAGASEPEFDDEPEEPGVWRYARVERASVIVDAADYFALMQQAMLKARHRIFLVGWDFDTRIHLALGRRWFHRILRRKYPRRLGSFLMWLARHRQGLEIRVLKWSLGLFQFIMRGYMLVDLARMASHEGITFKFDTHHPVGCSHHQKIAVLDDKLAVCGGIDMTQDRWDTRDHHEHDRRRRRPHGRRYGPWHDATMMFEGEAARVLGILSRERWERAGGEDLHQVPIPEESLWPDDLAVQFENVEIGIARTRAPYDGLPKICEIEDLLLAQIAQAKRFIYSENQYFTSRRIAEAIGERLKEDDPPEIVMVQPCTAEGWLEQQAMDYARVRLIECLGELDHKDRFRIYVPHTGETPIYVHAKLTIIDDRILRIGSANFNNRSMGLDSECDVFLDCDRPGNGHASAGMAAIRHSLLAEHCGLAQDEVGRLLEDDASMHRLIARHGQGEGRSLRPYDIPDLSGVEEALADSGVLDPENPEEILEPFANGGLFRKGSLLESAARGVKKTRKRIGV